VNHTGDNTLMNDPRQSSGEESTNAQDNVCALRERPVLFRCGHSIFYNSIPLENLLLVSLLAFRLPCTIRDSSVGSLMRCDGLCITIYTQCGAIRGDAMRYHHGNDLVSLYACSLLSRFVDLFPVLLTSFPTRRTREEFAGGTHPRTLP
jgi:hypothetical protein